MANCSKGTKTMPAQKNAKMESSFKIINFLGKKLPGYAVQS
jgi:hypothetical protein